MPDTPSILFVCLGNICRSPLAEAAMRAQAQARGLVLHVDSAGTGDWHLGCPPDPRAQAVAARHGIDIAHLRARQVVAEDFLRFDHVVALDRRNLDDLARIAPARTPTSAPTPTRARLSLLLDHVPGREGQSVADPYFGDEAGFVRTWAEVSEGARGLLALLSREIAAGA